MARSALLTATLLLAVGTLATAQSNNTNVSPLVDYFSNTNSSTYSYFWTALQAGNLDSYLNDSTLTLTIFAPTNNAWLKRLPTLTRSNGITVQQLFSQSKSAALQNMLQYHILNTPQKASAFTNGTFLATLANLCSDAKTLSVETNNGTIILDSAGGSRPKLLDKGLIVGTKAQSIVYAIDDVLLPSVVTIPLSVALSNFNTSSTDPYTPTIASKTDLLNQMQTLTQDEAPAPIYLQPATPPTTGAGSTTSAATTTPASPSPPATAAAPSSSTTSTNVGSLQKSPSPPPMTTPTPSPPPAMSGIDTGTVTGR